MISACGASDNESIGFDATPMNEVEEKNNTPTNTPTTEPTVPEPTTPEPNTPTTTKNLTQIGKDWYEQQCVACHGNSGDGIVKINSSTYNDASLTTKIEATMPPSPNMADCTGECAESISAYILNGYEVAANTPNPGTTPSENTKPMAAFNTLNNGKPIYEGTNLLVEVIASDSDGTIKNVKLSINDIFIRQELVVPYQWGHSVKDTQLKNLPVGKHKLSASVEDDKGAITIINQSFDVVTMPTTPTGNIKPIANFETLNDGKAIYEGTSLLVNVIASDPDGSVQNVQLILDGTLVSQKNNAPYEWTLADLTPGQHKLTARTIDNHNGITLINQFFDVVDKPIQLTGADLYEKSCKGCHGSLDNSSKKDRTESSINLALSNIPMMQFINLTPEEIKLITAALSTKSENAGSLELSEWQLTLLTAQEYVSSLRVLFGNDVPVPEFIPEVNAILGTPLLSTGISSISQSSTVNNYLENGLMIAEWLMSNQSRLEQAGLCNPASDNDPCISTSLNKVGKRIWRKALTSMEQTKIETLFDTLSSTGIPAKSAYTQVIAYMLQSPCFIYRMCEVPTDRNNEGHIIYNDYQMATQLAFTLTGATPTTELLQTASEGRLSTDADIEREFKTMVQSEQFVTRMKEIFNDHFHFTDFNEGQDISSELKQAMVQEINKTIEYVLLSERNDLRELFTTQHSFMNSTLAQHYGLDASSLDKDTFERMPLPDGRQGIMSFASSLTRYGSPTASIILRGLFVSEKLLCQDITLPGNLQALIETVADIPRDPALPFYEAESKIRLNQPTCAGCHLYMDTIGVGFQQYDEMGKFRPFDAEGRVHNNKGQLGNNTFTSMPDFSQTLIQDEKFASCFVENIYSRSMGRAILPNQMEDALLHHLTDEFVQANYSIQALMLAILKSKAIRSVSAIK